MIESIPYKNGKLQFAEHGEGMPLVLVHGYLESLHIWDKIAVELGKEHRVIRPDLPGHGGSGLLSGVHTMEMLAESIDFLLTELQIEQCALIGHSLGGYVTLAFAEMFPQRLAGFSLFHSTPFADTEEKRQNRDREIALVREGKKDIIFSANIPKAFADDNLEKMKAEVDYALGIARNTDEQGIVAMLEGMKKRPDRSALIRSSELPFIWVLGQKDNYIPFQDVRAKVSLSGSGAMAVLHNSGHMGFIEEMPQALDIIRAFVDTCMTR